MADETIYIIVMCAWRNLRGCLCSCFVLICLFVSTLLGTPRIIHHCKIKQRYYTKISKCIQTFISPQNQQKLSVSFDIFESHRIGKDKLRKFLLNTIDSKTPFGERLPPVRRPYMQRKQTSNFWQGATTLQWWP